MKRGFTMIELIFVIVIIGILAVIAIPKLTATRDDAKVVAAVDSAKQVLDNLTSEYTAKGELATDSITKANQAAPCFKYSFDSKKAELTIDNNVKSKDCGITNADAQNKLLEMAAKNGLLEKGGKPKKFQIGGHGVKF